MAQEKAGDHRISGQHVLNPYGCSPLNSPTAPGPNHWQQQNHRITESFRLEKTSKIIKSNRQPNTPMPAKPCPEVPHPHGF